MPEQNDYRVVVFGAAGVGKSSLVLRFVKGKNSPSLPSEQKALILCFRSQSVGEIAFPYRDVIH